MLVTDMVEEVVIVKSVILAPQEDTPRTAYADWLDDNTKFVDDKTRAAMEWRATLIRMQVELAREDPRTFPPNAGVVQTAEYHNRWIEVKSHFNPNRFKGQASSVPDYYRPGYPDSLFWTQSRLRHYVIDQPYYQLVYNTVEINEEDVRTRIQAHYQRSSLLQSIHNTMRWTPDPLPGINDLDENGERQRDRHEYYDRRTVTALVHRGFIEVVSGGIFELTHLLPELCKTNPIHTVCIHDFEGELIEPDGREHNPLNRQWQHQWRVNTTHPNDPDYENNDDRAFEDDWAWRVPICLYPRTTYVYRPYRTRRHGLIDIAKRLKKHAGIPKSNPLTVCYQDIETQPFVGGSSLVFQMYKVSV